MSDQEQRDARLLRQEDEPLRGLPDLADAPRRRRQDRRVDRLDGIDDDRRRVDFLDVPEDVVQADFHQDQQVRRDGPHPLSPQANLAGRLFAGDVEDPAAPGSDLLQDLEKERGFPDPRIPSYEDRRPGHQAASQDTVHLRNPRRQALAVLRLDGVERLGSAVVGRIPARSRLRIPDLLFHKGVPAVAGRALP
jgi:hypothetical protein